MVITRIEWKRITLSYAQVSTDSRLILVAEPFVHILVHKRGLADTKSMDKQPSQESILHCNAPAVSENDNLRAKRSESVASPLRRQDTDLE